MNKSDSSPSKPVVKISGLRKTYQRGSETLDVLRSIDLSVPEGDFLTIMGPSGSGKSTLLNIMGGIDKANAGTVEFRNERIDSLKESDLAAWRAKHVGIVFQRSHLISFLSAERNVELPLLLTRQGSAERKKKVAAALSLVGLANRAMHKPKELSGGQEARVGIARAIVSNPSLLLCDEPTGNLDRKSGGEILDLLKVLNNEYGKTIVLVTHDTRGAVSARRTLYLDDGVLTEKVSA